MTQRYAKRADYERSQYEVYEVETGKAVRTFPYKGELDRARASGLCTLVRQRMNTEHGDNYRAPPPG